MLAYIMHSSKGVFCCRYDFRECVIDIIAEMNQVKPISDFFLLLFFILSFYHQILSLIKKKSYVQL